MAKTESIFKTKLDIEQFLQWIAALRSGDYKQAKHSLQLNDGYCCLGVGCILFGTNLATSPLGDGVVLIGGIPENQRKEGAILPDWLHNIDFNFSKFNYRYKDRNYVSVANLNDYGLTFIEIADILMEKYQPEIDAVMNEDIQPNP